MNYVLGIDIGTGSVKAVAVNTHCIAFSDSQYHYSFSSPKPGYNEQDPEQIWSAFTKVIKAVTDKTGKIPSAVGLSSAMHSVIPVDGNCRALAPMITWVDNRSSEIAKRLRATAGGMAVYKATGTPLHAMSPLCKIIWIKENDPELFSKTYKFISIKEYIWYKLFNEFIIDHSGASSTGLFDITQLEWYQDALSLAGIGPQKLSEPVLTNYTKNFTLSIPQLDFLTPGLPFIAGASDGCLANLGSMANQPGLAAITIGTSGAVRVASSKPLPNEDAMTFSYILDKETYICGGPVNNGGIAMQWWIKNFVGPELADAEYEQAFQQIAGIAPGSDGLIFLPYLTGERAPIWDSESCGNFFGVKLAHTKAHFSRAVLEGICYALKDVLEAVEKKSETITQINISGGFVKSEVWVQTLADITGKNMAISQTEDASAVGAAFMALKATGLITGYPGFDAANTKIITPHQKSSLIYAERFLIYKQLYADLQHTMHQACR